LDANFNSASAQHRLFILQKNIEGCLAWFCHFGKIHLAFDRPRAKNERSYANFSLILRVTLDLPSEKDAVFHKTDAQMLG
jgi:hypothetical protein